MVIEAHQFRDADVIGGHPVLDWVNTVTARDTIARDWIDSYHRVIEWAGLAGAFPAANIASIGKLARSEPVAGVAKALERLKSSREALFGVLSAVAKGEIPPSSALGLVEDGWHAAIAASHFEVVGEYPGLAIRLGAANTGLEWIRLQLTADAVELLRSPDARLIRMCDGPSCAWLFLDRSKAGRRRWCDMKTCGNAAKSRRHFARAKTNKRQS
jgi:predicted RNA-binding Zn ribbon-like protein